MPARFVWQISPTATTRGIRYTINGLSETVNLAAGDYRWVPGAADDLAAVLETALDTHTNSAGGDHTVTLNTGTGYITITRTLDNNAATLEWSHAGTTVDPAWFGFAAIDQVGTGPPVSPATWVSDYQAGHMWYPNLECLTEMEIPVQLAGMFDGVAAQGRSISYGTWITAQFTFMCVEPVRVLQYHADDTVFAAQFLTAAADPNIALENLFTHLHTVDDGVWYFPDRTTTTPVYGPYYRWGERTDFRSWATPEASMEPYYRCSVYLKR